MKMKVLLLLAFTGLLILPIKSYEKIKNMKYSVHSKSQLYIWNSVQQRVSITLLTPIK